MTTTHPDLFDICERKHGGADTSKAANRSVAELKGEMCKAIFNFIRDYSCGLTCEDVELAMSLSHQTASARLSELRAEGWIYDTGLRRPTISGRSARVYKAREQ